MARITIPREALRQAFEVPPPDLPKYATQLLNLANQIAQATRPAKVGRLHELFEQLNPQTVEEWKTRYLQEHADAIDEAVERIAEQLEKFRESIEHIGDNEIRAWLMDLIIYKTWEGLKIQDLILSWLAQKRQRSFRRASPEEEARGIDGFIGEEAVSIKPESYKSKAPQLPEKIRCVIIYYENK